MIQKLSIIILESIICQKIPGECLSYFSYSIYNSHPCPRTYPKPCQLQIMTSPISMTPSLNSSIFLEYCLWSVYFNSPSIYWLLQYPSSSTSCAVLCLVTCRVWLCNPMDCSPPGSSVHGNSPGKNTGVGCHALLQGIFATQQLNPGLLHCRQILYHT